jgi:hypothetical protein
MELGESKHKHTKNKLWFGVAVVLIVALAAVSGFFFWKWQSLKSSPSVTAEESSARVIEKVGKIYDLPSKEKPTVALIQDKKKLEDQSFFDKAQNGDYLLMYTNSKLALIYREQDGKLINVGPISIDTAKNKEQQTDQTQ